jgi:molecular chaperone DnaK
MYLGIDLGTSNSAIVGNDGGQLRLFKTVDGYDVLPSAIMIDRRGALFVGKKAYDQDALSPEDVGKRFKRLMGTTSPVTFKRAGRTISAEEASGEVLKALLAQARMAAGSFEIDGAIVTIPAAFNQMQSEATMRAAQRAGIERIGLLQEPVAAAMATLADRREKSAALSDGVFLIYDLGGGTFDAAIVQAIGGVVNVVAHSGVNMLGGTDFDRKIVNNMVRPWLLDNFNLPEDFQKQPQYERILRIAAYCAEKAKIELSSRPLSAITADESQLGTRDADGKEIYFDIPLSVERLVELVIEDVDRSIEECRRLLQSSGYRAADINHLVFIGGPTRMPLVRDRVPEQLAIAADLNTDPMTAVASGAAIYAESREWTSGVSTAKSSRAAAVTKGPVRIEYGYPERTPDERFRLRVTAAVDALGCGYTLQLESDIGWTSGQLPLDASATIEDIPLAKRGENKFRVVVFDELGAPIAGAETRFVVKRTDAAAQGTPATHALGVKVVEGNPGSETNALDELIRKGEMLPAKGVKYYRAARDLRHGDGGFLDFEVFQLEPNVSDPKLSLHVGAFHIAASDLEPGDVIRRGERVKVYWTLDENGLLGCALEVDAIGRRFDTGKMFTDQGAQLNFAGEDGNRIATSVLDVTQVELDRLQGTLGDRVGKQAADLQQRIHRQKQELANSYEADTRRSITEEARTIRQEIAKIRENPANVGLLVSADIQGAVAHFDQEVRPSCTPAVADRYDRLVRQAREEIALGKIDDAKRSLSEMRSLTWEELNKQPAFVIASFRKLAQERHLAIDKALHDQVAQAGEASANRHDMNGVYSAMRQILDNRVPTSAKTGPGEGLAGLMRS